MPSLDPVAALFLVIVGLVLPALCVRSHVLVSRGVAMPTRGRVHRNTLIMLGVLTAFAVWVARRVGIGLFPEPRVDGGLAAITAGVVVVLVVFGAVRWRVQGPRRRARMVAILPRKPRDYVGWLAVSAAAGVGEEIIYRGVLTSVLAYLTGSWGAAAVMSAGVFGLSHAMQGWAAVGITFGMALLAQWLVLRAGDLYLAMAAHFTYDVAVGVVYPWMDRRAGLFEGARG